MTTIQKLAITGVITAAVATAVYEHHDAAQSRELSSTLQTQQVRWADDLRKAEAAATSFSNQLAVIGEENRDLKASGPQTEVLKLRGEVAALRSSLTEAESRRIASATLPASAAQPENEPLLRYLGDPVPADVNTNPAFTKPGLTVAVRKAADSAGIEIKSLEIDDSEFPPLIGIKCNSAEDLEKLQQQLRNLPGYQYGGSTSSQAAAAFSLVPYESVPDSMRDRVMHRVMVRRSMFFDSLASRQ
jgi:hypothetical protein